MSFMTSQKKMLLQKHLYDAYMLSWEDEHKLFERISNGFFMLKQ